MTPFPWQADKYSCELRFYDKSRQLITKFETCDGWSLATDANKHLIDQHGEFYIHVEAFISRLKTQAIRCSFVEVFYNGEFMQRNFIRAGVLVPFMSEIENRNECQMIRKKLITSTPYLSWRKIIRASFWGKPSKDIKKYLLKRLHK